MKEVTHFFKTLSTDSVKCLLCPHNCVIDNGKRGFCGTRENIEGKLFTLIYAQVVSIAVDPIEKKPVFHYKPGSRVLSLGTAGCNLRCKHCQNWQLSCSLLEELNAEVIYPKELLRLANETNCQGVAWTYNEPTIWWEYIVESAKLLKKEKFYTVLVTNGFINRLPLSELLELIDVYRVDIKAFFKDTFQKITGSLKVEVPLESAILAKKRGLHVEVVTNIIPSINDREEEIREIAKFIKNELGRDVPWHITRFFPYHQFIYFPPTPLSKLIEGQNIGRESGLDHIYLGNVDWEKGGDTICPSCKNVVIQREGYTIKVIKVDLSGRCKRCGKILNIYF